MDGARVLIVCTGNICRSPMAEVVLRELARQAGVQLSVDSAGTGSWHEGEGMDPRAAAALALRGYDGGRHVARVVERAWLAQRDLVLAADRGHRRYLDQLADGLGRAAPIRLLSEFGEDVDSPDVPDPYYGDAAEFAGCLALIERCCAGVVAQSASLPTR